MFPLFYWHCKKAIQLYGAEHNGLKNMYNNRFNIQPVFRISLILIPWFHLPRYQFFINELAPPRPLKPDLKPLPEPYDPTMVYKYIYIDMFNFIYLYSVTCRYTQYICFYLNTIFKALKQEYLQYSYSSFSNNLNHVIIC